MQWSILIALTAPPSLPLAEAVPVVDIDGTLFIQGGLFLLLMFILQGLLFKPWLAVREKRAQRIEGALAASTRLKEEAHELGLEYDARLSKARDHALGVRNDARHAAEGEMATIVADAREKAGAALDVDRANIERQGERVQKELASRVDELARDVAARVIGRTV